MIKIFCSICKEETTKPCSLDIRDINRSLKWNEICPGCKDKILLYIQSITQNREGFDNGGPTEKAIPEWISSLRTEMPKEVTEKIERFRKEESELAGMSGGNISTLKRMINKLWG